MTKVTDRGMNALMLAKDGPLFGHRGMYKRPNTIGFHKATIDRLVTDGLLTISATRFGKPMAVLTAAGRELVGSSGPGRKRQIDREEEQAALARRLADRIAP